MWIENDVIYNELNPLWNHCEENIVVYLYVFYAINKNFLQNIV